MDGPRPAPVEHDVLQPESPATPVELGDRCQRRARAARERSAAAAQVRRARATPLLRCRYRATRDEAEFVLYADAAVAQATPLVDGVVFTFDRDRLVLGARVLGLVRGGVDVVVAERRVAAGLGTTPDVVRELLRDALDAEGARLGVVTGRRPAREG